MECSKCKKKDCELFANNVNDTFQWFCITCYEKKYGLWSDYKNTYIQLSNSTDFMISEIEDK